jgi:hypothetical protein
LQRKLGGAVTETSAIKKNFEQWLQNSDLKDKLEVEKLRWRTPEGVEAGNQQGKQQDKPILTLELLYLGHRPDSVQETQGFAALVRTYRSSTGASLSEALFYKLVQLADTRRSEAVVQIFVVDATYEIAFNTSSGRLTCVARNNRDPTMRNLSLDLTSASRGVNRQAVALGSHLSPTELPATIEGSLTGFFNRMKAAHIWPKERGPGYAAVRADGFRRVVLPEQNYWERLYVSILVSDLDKGGTAVCMLTGHYAVGHGPSQPADDSYADMDPKYSAELSHFGDNLLQNLKRDLAAQH